MFTPIYKDVFKTIKSTGFANFSIGANGVTVYNGRAFVTPGSQDIKLNINNIAQNYLSNEMTRNVFENTFTETNGAVDIDLYIAQNLAASYMFYNNWGYREPYIINNPVAPIIKLSDPVDNIIDPRQYVVNSLLVDKAVLSPLKFEIKIKPNKQSFQVLNWSVINNKPQIFAKKISNIEPGGYVEFPDGTKVYAKETCCDYCLYYFNEFGGLDSLLTYGNSQKSVDIKPNYYGQVVDNNTINGAQVNYKNELSETIELRTNWLTDKQAQKMRHLFTSQQIYLHNLKTDEILPVSITNKQYVEKTYQNNGNKLVNFEINLKINQNRIKLN